MLYISPPSSAMAYLGFERRTRSARTPRVDIFRESTPSNVALRVLAQECSSDFDCPGLPGPFAPIIATHFLRARRKLIRERVEAPISSKDFLCGSSVVTSSSLRAWPLVLNCLHNVAYLEAHALGLNQIVHFALQETLSVARPRL